VIIIPLMGATWIVGLVFVVDGESSYLPWIFMILCSMLVSNKSVSIQLIKIMLSEISFSSTTCRLNYAEL